MSGRPIIAVCASLLAIVLSLLACDETKPGARNSAPIAAITSHSAGSSVPDDEIYVMGEVSDGDDAADTLLTTWSINGLPVCIDQTPDDDGRCRCLVTLSGGGTEITLEVEDPVGLTGEAVVEVTVVQTQPPTAQIDSPSADASLYSDVLTPLLGSVSDAEDDSVSLRVRWSSDLDGTLDGEITQNDAGSVSAHSVLSPGEHAITLQAEDSHGKTGSDTVIVSVGPPNTPPSCEVLSPTEGTSVSGEDPFLLQGEAADPDQLAHELLAGWRSSLDGTLATAVPSTAGDINTMVSGLSVGIHIISLTVSDELGAMCTDTVAVQVDG
jgi:hypothetical protein